MSLGILQQIDLPDDSGSVVLYDWMMEEPNLVLLRDGKVQWRALPPEPKPDCFTEISMDGDNLTAFTFSCYRVHIDIHTGEIIARQFTK